MSNNKKFLIDIQFILKKGHVQHYGNELVESRVHSGRSGERGKLQTSSLRKKRLLAAHQRMRRLGPRKAGVRSGSGAAEKQTARHQTQTCQGRHVALQEILRGRHTVG